MLLLLSIKDIEYHKARSIVIIRVRNLESLDEQATNNSNNIVNNILRDSKRLIRASKAISLTRFILNLTNNKRDQELVDIFLSIQKNQDLLLY